MDCSIRDGSLRPRNHLSIASEGTLSSPGEMEYSSLSCCRAHIDTPYLDSLQFLSEQGPVSSELDLVDRNLRKAWNCHRNVPDLHIQSLCSCDYTTITKETPDGSR